MFREDDIQFALEATRILHEPDRRIDTFGTTRFSFTILTEPMDGLGACRVREGRIEAGSPSIVTPEMIRDMNFEGFGDQAERFARWWKAHGPDLAIMRYGFTFRKTDVSEHEVHDPVEDIRARLVEQARRGGDPLLAVLEGVEDTWEVSLLKFSMDMIQKSQNINLFDFKRKGML